MSIKQIAIFVENKPGALASITEVMAEKNINIKAFSIADTKEFGIMRIVVENPEETDAALKEAGYITKITPVLAVEIKDVPGSMSKILKVLADAWISVEYTYAFTSYKEGEAYMMFKVNDTDKATDALKAAGIAVAEQSEIF